MVELAAKPHLQSLVDGRGAGGLVFKLQRVLKLTGSGRGGTGHGRVRRQKQVQLRPLGPRVPDREDPISGDRIFDRKIPRLAVRRPEARINGESVARDSRSDLRKAFL